MTPSLRPWLIALALIATASCHIGPRPYSVAWDELSPEQRRDLIVQDAEDLSKNSTLRIGNRVFPYDCSGFVGAVLYRNGMDVFGGAQEEAIRGNGVRILHDYALKHGNVFRFADPAPGDLVFFSNTYDRNRDGKPNDELTHVGIVETVDSDGTVTFIHNLGYGVRRYAMNLQSPSKLVSAEGKPMNHYLRRRRPKDASKTAYLTSALFAGYATLFPSEASNVASTP